MNEESKRNLIPLGNGKYVSKDDPNVWLKIYKAKPYNPEALYHMSLYKERVAKDYLLKYRDEKIESDLQQYHDKMKDSIELMEKSMNRDYDKAKIELKRIEREYTTTSKGIKPVVHKKKSTKGSSFSTMEVAIVATLCIFLGFIMGSLIISFYNMQNPIIEEKVVEQIQYDLLPYTLIEDNSKFSIEDFSTYQTEIVEFNDSVDKEKIKLTLLEKVVDMYQVDNKKPKFIQATQYSNEGITTIGYAIWDGKEKEIKIYLTR